jgi:hypothetical protein
MKKLMIYAILFLIIGITIGLAVNVSATTSSSIPSWIKNTAKWWADGQISDAEFIKALQYLINQGILVVPQSNSSNQSTTTHQGFQTYTNNVYKFSIQYPSNWIEKESFNGKVDLGSSSYQFNAIVVFTPSSQDNTKYITNVNVKTIAGINGTSLDDLLTGTKSGLQDLFGVNDFKETGEGKIKTNGNDAFYIEYVININGVIAKVKQVVIPNGDNAFVITYGSSEDTYNKYLQQFDGILSTFKFL